MHKADGSSALFYSQINDANHVYVSKFVILLVLSFRLAVHYNRKQLHTLVHGSSEAEFLAAICEWSGRQRNHARKPCSAQRNGWQVCSAGADSDLRLLKFLEVFVETFCLAVPCRFGPWHQRCQPGRTYAHRKVSHH